MNDLLASIRQIIADDLTDRQGLGAAARPAGPQISPRAMDRIEDEATQSFASALVAIEGGRDIPAQRGSYTEPRRTAADEQRFAARSPERAMEDPPRVAPAPRRHAPAPSVAARAALEPAPPARTASRLFERGDTVSRFSRAPLAPQPGERDDGAAFAPSLCAVSPERADQPGSDAGPRGPERASRERAAPRTAAPAEERLTSPRTREAVGRSFEELSRVAGGEASRSLEDVVREMIRPHLRAWLDAHLGEIVEREVHREIERLTRRS